MLCFVFLWVLVIAIFLFKPQVDLSKIQLSPRFTFLFLFKPQVHLLVFG